MVRQQPQAVHTGFCCPLQHEWTYLQCVLETDVEQYEVLKNIIRQEIVPALFNAYKVPEEFDDLFKLPAAQGKIGVLSPVMEAPLNRATLLISTTHLTGVILQEHSFNLQDHNSAMDKGQIEGKARKQKNCKSTFSVVTEPLNTDFKGSMGRTLKAGQWLNMLPCYRKNTVLSQGEFKDGLIVQFGYDPADLLKHCNRCQKKISLQHVLDCKLGRLVATWNNEVQTDLARVSTQAYLKSAVHNKPYIKNGNDRENDKTAQDSPVTVLPTSADEDGKLWGNISGQFRCQVIPVKDGKEVFGGSREGEKG
eukprot:15333088-Ditylum_brightwellii.AAC.1